MNKKITEFVKKYFHIILAIICTIVFFAGVLLYLYIDSKQNLYQVEDYKFINSKGKVIFQLPKEYNIVGYYRDGHIVVGIKKDEVVLDTGEKGVVDMRTVANLAIIDNKGNITKLSYEAYLGINDNFYTLVPVFQNGYIIIQDKDGYHLINKRGKEVKNKDVKTALRNNLNPIEIEDETGITGYYIQDKNGKEIFRTNKNTRYKYFIGKFSEGLLLVSDKYMYTEDDVNFAYVNKHGKVILEIPGYEVPISYHYHEYWRENSDFHNGLANVIDKKTGGSVYIDKQSKVIIKGDYTYSTPFDNNIIRLYFCHGNDGNNCYKSIYVNRYGKIIYEIKKDKEPKRFSEFEAGLDFDKLKKIKIKKETEPEYLYYYETT